VTLPPAYDHFTVDKSLLIRYNNHDIGGGVFLMFRRACLSPREAV
jgi:hypothetical protein